MDIGPASKPRLTLLLKTIVAELGPNQHFGPGWLAAEVNQRYGDRLRKPVTTWQMSDVRRCPCAASRGSRAWPAGGEGCAKLAASP